MNRALISSRLADDIMSASSGPCIVEHDAGSDVPQPTATASWWTRGSVTIEAAFAISMVLVIVGVMAVANQVAATEASANAARHRTRRKPL